MNADDTTFHHFVLRTIAPDNLAPLSDHQLETMLDQTNTTDQAPLSPKVLAALEKKPNPARTSSRKVWLGAAAVAAVAGIIAFDNYYFGDAGDAALTATPLPEKEAVPAVPSGDTIRIALDFPKPMFVGTPVKAERANLELPDESKIVKEVIAPVGTTNIALNKPITSSDEEPIIGDLAMVADGDKDGADGSYVELGPGQQWVQIDLEKEATIHAIALWHFHKNARAYDDVIVQLSDDPDFQTGVTTVYNNDDDNSSAMGAGQDLAWIETNHGRVIPVGGQQARYVRLYSKGNTANEMNHYVEVEIYGQ